jgi:hypothetical protein
MRADLVSDLCQIPRETPVKHRDLRGRSDAHRLRKVVDGSGVGAFQCEPVRTAKIDFQGVLLHPSAFGRVNISETFVAGATVRGPTQERTRHRPGGDTDVADKVLSIFEPHTETIRKGKISKPGEFGKLVTIQESAHQVIITAYDVHQSDPPM